MYLSQIGLIILRLYLRLDFKCDTRDVDNVWVSQVYCNTKNKKKIQEMYLNNIYIYIHIKPDMRWSTRSKV